MDIVVASGFSPAHGVVNATEVAMRQRVTAGRNHRRPLAGWHDALDAGEAAALTLAQSCAVPLLIDERAATALAAELRVETISTERVLRDLIERKFLTIRRANRIVGRMREMGTYLPIVSFTA